MRELLLKHIISTRGAVSFRVNGNSMWPYIEDGNTVVIKDCSYREGDVIVFNYYNEGLLVHRLLREEKDVLLLRGDNSLRIERVLKNSVIGVVVEVIK